MSATDIVREVVRGRIARGELPADSLEQMGLSRMTAAEALRRARATMECGDSPVSAGCVCGAWDDWRYYLGKPHAHGASALLDGYTVEELTEAGG